MNRSAALAIRYAFAVAKEEASRSYYFWVLTNDWHLYTEWNRSENLIRKVVPLRYRHLALRALYRARGKEYQKVTLKARESIRKMLG